MLKLIKKIFKPKIIVPVLLLTLLSTFMPIQQFSVLDNTITIGFAGTAEAATADFVCDGINDHVQWQDALNDLPASGGKLIALAGNYDFGAVVSRAIDSVIIEGVGYGSYFANDGVTALFSAGVQDKWIFRDIRTDAGGITITNADDWIMENVWIGAAYWQLRVDTTITSTNYDIPFADISGAPSDGQAFIWTDSDTGEGSWLGTVMVAASDATAAEKVYAVLSGGAICDAASDETEINAELVAGVKVLLSSGTFEIDGTITAAVNNVTIEGSGRGTIINLDAGTNNPITVGGTGWTVKNLDILVNTVGNMHGLEIENITECLFEDIHVTRQGVVVNANHAIYIYGTTDRTCRLVNCEGDNQTTGHTVCNGIMIDGSASPHLIDCVGYGGDGGEDCEGLQDVSTGRPLIQGGKFYGGDHADGVCYGMLFGTNSQAIVQSAYGKGGSGASGNCIGIAIGDASSPHLTDCIGEGGDGGDYCQGFVIKNGASPTITGCTGLGGYGGLSCPGFYIASNADPHITGCTGTFQRFSQQWYYDDADNGRFRPFADHPYVLVGICGYVYVANAGRTLDVGTAIAGQQVFAALDISGTGYVYCAFNNVEVAANGYLYATVNGGAINDNDFKLQYIVATNYAGCYGLYMWSIGNAIVNTSTFISNGASEAMRIHDDALAVNNYALYNCHLETLDPASENAIEAQSATTDAPVYNCTFAGGIANITNFDTPTPIPLPVVIEHHVANDTLTTAETGSVHTNFGAGDNVTLTLPNTNVAGIKYTFIVMTAVNNLRVRVGAAAVQFIGLGTTYTDDGGNDGYLWADDEGESVTFYSDGSGDWVFAPEYGTWQWNQP